MSEKKKKTKSDFWLKIKSKFHKPTKRQWINIGVSAGVLATTGIAIGIYYGVQKQPTVQNQLDKFSLQLGDMSKDFSGINKEAQKKFFESHFPSDFSSKPSNSWKSMFYPDKDGTLKSLMSRDFILVSSNNQPFFAFAGQGNIKSLTFKAYHNNKTGTLFLVVEGETNEKEKVIVNNKETETFKKFKKIYSLTGFKKVNLEEIKNNYEKANRIELNLNSGYEQFKSAIKTKEKLVEYFNKLDDKAKETALNSMISNYSKVKSANLKITKLEIRNNILVAVSSYKHSIPYAEIVKNKDGVENIETKNDILENNNLAINFDQSFFSTNNVANSLKLTYTNSNDMDKLPSVVKGLNYPNQAANSIINVTSTENLADYSFETTQIIPDDKNGVLTVLIKVSPKTGTPITKTFVIKDRFKASNQEVLDSLIDTKITKIEVKQDFKKLIKGKYTWQEILNNKQTSTNKIIFKTTSDSKGTLESIIWDINNMLDIYVKNDAGTGEVIYNGNEFVLKIENFDSANKPILNGTTLQVQVKGILKLNETREKIGLKRDVTQ